MSWLLSKVFNYFFVLFAGYLVHYLKFDAWRYISKVHAARIEEADLPSADAVSGSTMLLDVYGKLLLAIEENAKKIDQHYRQDLKNFDLKELFQLINPLIFNFIVLTTMSLRERNIIMESDRLSHYLNGDLPLLETYKSENQRSHALFVRRVCLALEFIFVRVRGQLCNPLSFMITDIVNKYSGSVVLLQALNNTTNITYSYDTYKRLRLVNKFAFNHTNILI